MSRVSAVSEISRSYSEISRSHSEISTFDANKIEYCSIYMPPVLKFSGYNKLIDCIRSLRQCVYYDTKCVYYDTNVFYPSSLWMSIKIYLRRRDDYYDTTTWLLWYRMKRMQGTRHVRHHAFIYDNYMYNGTWTHYFQPLLNASRNRVFFSNLQFKRHSATLPARLSWKSSSGWLDTPVRARKHHSSRGTSHRSPGRGECIAGPASCTASTKTRLAHAIAYHVIANQLSKKTIPNISCACPSLFF
jgi:hypothetical protein